MTAELSLGAHIAVFGVASVVVWLAGGRLSAQAKAITERTGVGQAFVGTILLGGISSLPEMAMSFTAAARENGKLAVTTLLGGVQVTMAAIAIIDALIGGPPLTRDITRPVILLQGVLVIALLSLVEMGILLGDRSIGGALGVWSTLLAVAYVLILALIRVQERRRPWIVAEAEPLGEIQVAPGTQGRSGGLFWNTTLAGTATAIAGYVLAVSGEAIGERTGLGSNFTGLVLGGFATTLPELVTLYASVKLKQYEMAFADAFGTNLFSIMLIGFSDLIYPGPPILNGLGRFSSLAVLLGILTTAIYLTGLIDRGKRTFFGLGYDSIAALTAYAIGLFLLYHVRH